MECIRLPTYPYLTAEHSRNEWSAHNPRDVVVLYLIFILECQLHHVGNFIRSRGNAKCPGGFDLRRRGNWSQKSEVVLCELSTNHIPLLLTTNHSPLFYLSTISLFPLSTNHRPLFPLSTNHKPLFPLSTNHRPLFPLSTNHLRARFRVAAYN